MDSILIAYIAIFLLGVATGIILIGYPLTGKLAKLESQNARLRREIKQLKYEDRERAA
ncbi:MAG: hypothetical protein GXY86_08790 [Firmicutes bacterium]|nr:hypothetical protein [Bacillota bacterium]